MKKLALIFLLSGLFFSLILGQENGGKPPLKEELRLPPGQDFPAFWEKSNPQDKWTVREISM